jgi:hypothetical protein
MNIFYLHSVPRVAARMHCDKHVGKMLIESCQLLATCHHHYDNGHQITYKPTHAKHPSAIWVRQSPLHYAWLVELANALGREFWRRYDKQHKSWHMLHAELMQPPPAMRNLPSKWSPPTQAMPDEYKHTDAIVAYRRFYASKAQRMPLVYNRGHDTQPYWLRELLDEAQPLPSMPTNGNHHGVDANAMAML